MEVDTEVAGGFAPLNAATGEACRLAMQELWLVGRVLPVGARLMLRHVFRTGEAKPIEVVYAFALPRDGALRRFRVAGEGFSVWSELRPTEEAARVYEEGIERGHLATLARQYGDGVVNLAVGNVRPGETVTVHLEIVAGVEAEDGGFRLRFPFTLAPAYHSKARAIETAPGAGEIELPADGFDDLILPTWKADAEGLHAVGFSLSVCTPGEIREVASPSHPLRVQTDNQSRALVFLGTAKDMPNRDLVLDVRHRQAAPLVLAGTDAKGAGRFAAVIPSETFGRTPTGARRVAFVVDRSGSMQGRPMQQALGAVKACLGALSEEDRFGVVCFDNQVERVSASLLAGDKPGREKAAAFLRDIDAHGGTELAAGLRAATEILTGGGDILLLTDGQVMGTETIIGEAKAAGIRIHCLGIGSASQDRFLALLASQTGGLSRMVTPRERVDMAAMELFSTGGRPVACDVCIRARNLPGAKTAPHPADAVYAGTPLVVFGSTEGPAEGQLEISWKADSQPMSMVLPLTVPQGEPGEIVGLLQGARLITALDSEYLDGAEGAPGEKRRQSRIGRKLEALSRQFGLASRRMALVAVVQRKGDKAGEVPRTHVVPVGMPQDVQFYSYFTVGRPRGLQITGPQFMAGPPLPRAVVLSPADLCPPIPEYLDRHVEPARLVTTEDVLLELARRIEPDGGLPGESHEDRVLASLLAVLLFAQEGHTAGAGAFMPHVQRLLTFLKKADLSSFSAEQQALVAQVLNRLAQPGALRGPWLKLVRAYLNEGTLKRTDAWKQLGGSLK